MWTKGSSDSCNASSVPVGLACAGFVCIGQVCRADEGARSHRGHDGSRALLENVVKRRWNLEKVASPRAAAFGLFAMLFAVSAFAWTNDESPRTVLQVGAYGGPIYYVRIVQGVHANCVNQRVDIDASTPLGKALFALMMAAKATAHPVRIGYSVPASIGTCTLELAGLE